nr:M20/M25/M40 family metallo-hydrolase [Turicimonas muris]
MDYCPDPEYDPELVDLMKKTIVEQFGEKALANDCGGGGEDFHFYKIANPEVRTIYFGVGSGATPGLHARDMHFDDSVLPLASQLLVEFIRKING